MQSFSRLSTPVTAAAIPMAALAGRDKGDASSSASGGPGNGTGTPTGSPSGDRRTGAKHAARNPGQPFVPQPARPGLA